jgi:hypothetical protein
MTGVLHNFSQQLEQRGLDSKRSRFKDVSLQAKNLTEKEQTAKNKDLRDC